MFLCPKAFKLVTRYAKKNAKSEFAWDIPYLNRKIFLFCYQIFKSDFLYP